ncbi:MAG: MFS transporter [Chloroflexi bacterium]|nr:MFS transporter [Chloroflexota bacterium]
MSVSLDLTAAAEAAHGRRWLMLGLAALAQFASASLQIGLGFLLPFVRDDLGISTAQAGLLLAFFAAGVMLMAFPSGAATDQLGERRILATGLCVASVAIALAALQSNYLVAAGLLVVAGLGTAPTHPAGARLVLRLFPPRERGFALGVRQASVPLGGLLVAAMVAPLTTAISWRAGLGATGGIMFCMAVLIALFLVDPSQRRRGPARPIWSDVPKLMKNGNFGMANAATFWMNFGQGTVTTYLSLFVLQELGAGPAVAALALAVVNASASCGRILFGMLSDRCFGGKRGKPLILVQSLAIAAAFVLFFMPAGSSLAVLLVGCAFVGTTMTGWNPIGLALVAESAGREGAGGATGFDTVVLNSVTVLLPPLFGSMIDATGSVRSVWLAAALALALGILTTSRVREAER